MRAEFRELGETGAQEGTHRGSEKKKGSKFQGKGVAWAEVQRWDQAWGHFIPKP